uniref:Peptidase family S41 n=1 Tax=uncultured Thiotrichaceae bacterium TaxID=298394 RepID=A0A6S6TYQ6_9GAMM|nr:MAG: Peptidase family S41 [uncultured Thiotrichaceae bacterium]
MKRTEIHTSKVPQRMMGNTFHRNSILRAIALSITFSLSSCDVSHSKASDEGIYGIWEQVGYGNVFVINKNGADYYQYTRQTCMQEKSLSNRELDENIHAIEVLAKQDAFSAYSHPEATFKTYFTRLDQLPGNCQAGRLITTATPTQQFEHLWHNFNDYYAFFNQRGVDWQQQYVTYRPQVNDDMSQEALFAVLSDMLAPIDDAHVSLDTYDDDFSPEQPDNLTTDLHRVFQRQSVIRDFDEFSDAQLNVVREVQQTYLSNTKQSGGSDNEVVLWGKLSRNIGYLQLNSMADIGNNDFTAIKHIMQQVISDLQDVDALVIDVRLNGGGFDGISMIIANYFARTEQLAMSKYTNNWQGRTHNVEAYLKPTEQQLHVPIALLSSDMTVSAAEIFLLTMRSIPDVSVVGEASSGALSDILSKTLLNGMEVSLSNEIYLDHAGRNFEGSGVPVDIATTAFDLDGFAKGRDTALEAAIEHLKTQIQ